MQQETFKGLSLFEIISAIHVLMYESSFTGSLWNVVDVIERRQLSMESQSFKFHALDRRLSLQLVQEPERSASY